ncbi:MAG: matrixin family metalloprotease [Pyrinomonadaceae bacterium]|nr:matrixin family metalloprotease [Pyrinomonadaceae bacterium]
MSSSLFELIKDLDPLETIEKSAKKWEEAANVKFEFYISDKKAVSLSDPDGVNLITISPIPENLEFLGKNLSVIPAKTKLFYNRNQIVEADIVLNPYVQFSSDGRFGTFDLETIILHEMGHLLGLKHVFANGSIMNPNLPKNGVYGISQIFLRNLAQSDISQIRALYGTVSESCCAIFKGRISVKNEKGFLLQIWLEEKETGRVEALAPTDSSGSFIIGGIRTGTYKVFVQGTKRNKRIAKELGLVSLEANNTYTFEKAVYAYKIKQPYPEYLGFNGQIAKTAIGISAGRNYLLYIAGKSFLTEKIKVSTNSPYLRVIPETFSIHAFDDEIQAISFGVEADSNLPAGEYSLIFENENGEKTFFVAALISNLQTEVPQNFFIF